MIAWKTGKASALAFALWFGAGAAMTEPMSVRQSAIQLALPNSGPRGVQDYRVGDMVLDVPLFWANAATLRDEVSVQTDETLERLAAGTVLPMQMLAESGGEPLRAYCTPRRGAERAADRGVLGALPAVGWWARRAIRSATDRQLCLIDSDGDGRADQSLVVGDGPPAIRTPHAIAPVAIDIADLVPISSRDRVQIKLTRVGRDWAELTLIILQEGYPRRFSEISGRWGESLRVSRVTQGGPGSILGADFWLQTVDRNARTARIEWPAGVDPRQFAVIPDRLDLVRR